MPVSAPRPCKSPGCRKLAASGTGWCADHKPKPKDHGSAGMRKTGRKGVADRERIRRRDEGLCQMCLKAGKITLGTQVDHIKSFEDGGADTDENKWLLCTKCHKAKSASERRAAGRGG